MPYLSNSALIYLLIFLFYITTITIKMFFGSKYDLMAFIYPLGLFSITPIHYGSSTIIPNLF